MKKRIVTVLIVIGVSTFLCTLLFGIYRTLDARSSKIDEIREFHSAWMMSAESFLLGSDVMNEELFEIIQNPMTQYSEVSAFYIYHSAKGAIFKSVRSEEHLNVPFDLISPPVDTNLYDYNDIFFHLEQTTIPFNGDSFRIDIIYTLLPVSRILSEMTLPLYTLMGILIIVSIFLAIGVFKDQSSQKKRPEKAAGERFEPAKPSTPARSPVKETVKPSGTVNQQEIAPEPALPEEPVASPPTPAQPSSITQLEESAVNVGNELEQTVQIEKINEDLVDHTVKEPPVTPEQKLQPQDLNLETLPDIDTEAEKSENVSKKMIDDDQPVPRRTFRNQSSPITEPPITEERERQSKARLYNSCGIGIGELLIDRLTSELQRSAAFDLDLVLLIIKSPAEIPSDYYAIMTDRIRNSYMFHDLIYEYQNDGLALIFPDMDLEQGIRKSESLLSKCIVEDYPNIQINMGLASRNGRLLEGERLIKEADGALRKAMDSGESTIMAFRTDPNLYRKFIATQL